VNSWADRAGRLRVTGLWPSAGPWRIGILATLILGTLGSLSLSPAALVQVPGARIYVAAVAIWINSIVIGYIIGITRVAYSQFRRDLDRLRPLLVEELDSIHARMTAPQRPLALVVATAVGLGIGVLASGEALPRLLARDPERWVFAWTLLLLPLLWALILHVFWLMLELTIGLYRLARGGLRVDFSNRVRLDVFAGFGFRNLLLIVIGLAVIPVQAILTGEIEVWDFVPAVSVAVPAGLIVLILPILGAHRTLVEVKRRELDRVDADVATSAPGSDRALLLHLYRGEVTRSSEWPVSFGGIARVVAYALLPPLAWTAAAVVEAWVSLLIG